MGKPRLLTRPTPMLRKQIGQMAKLLGVWKSSRLKVDETGIETKSCVRPTMNTGRPSFLGKNDGLDSICTSRRQVVLNRHYTEIVSDVLSLELKKEFEKFNITITSIETGIGNKSLGIYYTTNQVFDPNLHDSLNSIVGLLTRAIAERDIIGRVPLISFVYDKVAEIDNNLNAALRSVDIKPPQEDKDLTISTTNTVSEVNSSTPEEQCFVSNRFSAPVGMVNAMAGLDYPSLYDQVSSKLAHGRAKSSRMIPPTTLANQQPLLRVPMEPHGESADATHRVLQMQKFLLSQRKKSEYVAKLKRKQQLLFRDAYKWDVAEES